MSNALNCGVGGYFVVLDFSFLSENENFSAFFVFKYLEEYEAHGK